MSIFPYFPHTEKALLLDGWLLGCVYVEWIQKIDHGQGLNLGIPPSSSIHPSNQPSPIIFPLIGILIID